MDENELWQNLMPKSDDPHPGLLYHYTTPEGFRGIVESSCIWATNARYLNDTSEVTHAYSEEYVRPWLDTILPISTETHKNAIRSVALSGIEHFDAFVVSLTGNASVPDPKQADSDDRLSQSHAPLGSPAQAPANHPPPRSRSRRVFAETASH